MATQFAVDLVFKSQTQQLDQVANKIQKFERDIAKLKGQNPFEGTERGAKGASAAVDKVGASAKGASGAIGGLRNALLTLGLGAFVKTIYSAAAEIERTKTQLTTLTGSAQEAERVFSQLQAINKQSPFELKDLTGAASKLSAFGVTTQDLVVTTERLGKVAAGTGQELGGIATAYGQVMAKGKLQGEELLQFQERGIDVGGELQRMLGVTKEQFAQMTSKGQISSKLVEEAIKRMTSETGRFGNAFKNTAGTMDAQLSNLRDAFFNTAGALGKAFQPVFSWMIAQLTNILTLIGAAVTRWQGVQNLGAQKQAAIRSQAAGEANKKFPGFNPFDNKKGDFYNKRVDQLADREVNKVMASKATAGLPKVTNLPVPKGQQDYYKSLVGSGAAPKGGGGGGGGASNKAGEDAAQLKAKLDGLNREMQLITTISGMKEKERLAELAGDQQTVVRLQGEQKLAELQKSKLDAIAQAETAAEKAKQGALFDLQIDEQKKENAFELAKLESDRQKTLEEKLTGFEREIELGGLKTEEAKKLKQIEYDILDMKKEGLLVSDDEIAKYREKAIAASKVGGGKGKIESYMNKLKTELGDTEGMIVSLASTIESEIGSAMSNAIMGVIDGTMTAQQAFSQMFKNIGKAFIDMATQMIAKALIMKVLGILGGGGGGGGGGGFNMGSLGGLGMNTFNPANAFPRFAEGGFVNGPTNALIGEGGESEYVIPSSKMSAAMSNYSAGKRGSSVIADSSGSNNDGGGGGSIDVSYSVTEVNSVRYVTEDQFQSGLARAAKAGADGGYSKSMRTLQNSRSQRARVGMR